MYICDFSRSVGVGSAMCLNTRGLVRSVIRRIVPPLPAESRPSKTMQIFAPVALTHSCMATSSPCRRRIWSSYSLVFILAGADTAVSAAPPGDVAGGSAPVDVRVFFAFVDFLLICAGFLSPRVGGHTCCLQTLISEADSPRERRRLRAAIVTTRPACPLPSRMESPEAGESEIPVPEGER